MKYQDLQKVLKIAKTQGLTTIRLNSKKVELEKEYARIQAIAEPAPEIEPDLTITEQRRKILLKMVETLTEQGVDRLWDHVMGSNPAPAPAITIAEAATPDPEPEQTPEPAPEASSEPLSAIAEIALDYETMREIGREILDLSDFGTEHQIGIRIMNYCEILASQDAGRIERELRSEDLIDQHKMSLTRLSEHYGYDLTSAIVIPLCLEFIKFAAKHNLKALKRNKYDVLRYMIKDGKEGDFTVVQAAVANACR